MKTLQCSKRPSTVTFFWPLLQMVCKDSSVTEYVSSNWRENLVLPSGVVVGFIIYLNRIKYCNVSLLKFKSKYWLNYAVLKAVRETIAMPQSGAFHNNLHPEGNQSEMTLIIFQLSFLVETGTKKRKTKHSDVGVSKHLLTSFQVRKERMFLLLCPSPTCRSAALGSHRGRCQATKATLFILIRGT